MQRKSKPLTWRFKGVSDALDESASFTGAMSALTNLVPDPTTAMLWQCRPAAVQLVNFNSSGGPFSSGFSSGFQQTYFPGPNSAGFISVYRVIGTIVYGMMADAAIPGHDAPFAFNLLTNTAITVQGTINATTTPVSPPTINAWTPPQMGLVGVKLMVAHSGFTGVGGNFVGWFDLTNPLVPIWNAGNLTGLVQFTVAPTGIVQFFNRAYYIHNNPIQPAVIFSDVLNATNVTNANQVLTFGDNVPLTALGPLPLSNQLGGIIQAVMVFKNVSNIWQITGDAAFSPPTLETNSLNVATGTLAPNSVCTTSKGLAFIAPDGLRIIDFNASVSDPIGLDGKGVSVPFISSAVPSRIAATCNGTLLRVTTQNAAMSGSPSQEYWFDFARGIWTGPHSFPASLIQPYANTFIMTPVGINASLWQSDYVQSITSVFVENGQQMTWNAATSLLPDTDQIVNNCMTEATMDFALPPNIGSVAISALDQAGAVMDTVSIASSTGGTSLWGSVVWGAFIWGGAGAPALAPYQLQWHEPIVFSRMKMSLTGQSAAGLKLGALHMRYQMLNIYTNTAAAA